MTRVHKFGLALLFLLSACTTFWLVFFNSESARVDDVANVVLQVKSGEALAQYLRGDATGRNRSSSRPGFRNHVLPPTSSSREEGEENGTPILVPHSTHEEDVGPLPNPMVGLKKKAELSHSEQQQKLYAENKKQDQEVGQLHDKEANEQEISISKENHDKVLEAKKQEELKLTAQTSNESSAKGEEKQVPKDLVHQVLDQGGGAQELHSHEEVSFSPFRHHHVGSPTAFVMQNDIGTIFSGSAVGAAPAGKHDALAEAGWEHRFAIPSAANCRECVDLEFKRLKSSGASWKKTAEYRNEEMKVVESSAGTSQQSRRGTKERRRRLVSFGDGNELKIISRPTIQEEQLDEHIGTGANSIKSRVAQKTKRLSKYQRSRFWWHWLYNRRRRLQAAGRILASEKTTQVENSNKVVTTSHRVVLSGLHRAYQEILPVHQQRQLEVPDVALRLAVAKSFGDLRAGGTPSAKKDISAWGGTVNPINTSLAHTAYKCAIVRYRRGLNLGSRQCC